MRFLSNQKGELNMKVLVALAALSLGAAPALAACEHAAYQEHGGRLASATFFPLAAALTVVSLPAAGIGVLVSATGHHEAGANLMAGTTDTLCYTGGFASHAIQGHR